MDIISRLKQLSDEKYADFQAKLTPGVPRELFIGVRVPEARKLARELYKGGEYDAFLEALPHKYYDENILHSLILSEVRDFGRCCELIDRFLPFVDNWAVCDLLSPVCFKKNRAALIDKACGWAKSDLVYTSRFGVDMLMGHFLDDDFSPSYLEVAAGAVRDDYYSKMAVAWFFATALAKQWDEAIKYVVGNRLEVWTHNKTIQKACESYRITDEQKEFLKKYRRKTNGE